MKRILALAVLLVAVAGCGVRTQDQPDVLRSPPAPPTATPSATEQPTQTPGTASPSPG